MAGNEVLEEQPDQTTLTSRYVERSIEFIRENRQGPFFLYFAHMHTHLPLYAPDPFCRRAELDAQKGEYYGGWFEEKDWIGWQKHMENLISRLDELIAQPEQEIEFIKTQTMKENGITM